MNEELAGLIPRKSSEAVFRQSDEEPAPGIPTKVNQAGHSTRQALSIYIQLISAEEKKFYDNLSWRNWLKDALHHNSSRALCSWSDLLLLGVQMGLALVTLAVQGEAERIYVDRTELIILVAVLVASGVFNGILSCVEARNRHLELWRQVSRVLQSLRDNFKFSGNKKFSEWKPSHYPDLHTPDSPSVSLQWTYRDQVIVNLPAILLVPGDIIVVRPCRQVFCNCSILPEEDGSNSRLQGLNLRSGETFQPDIDGEMEAPVAPLERTIAADCRFVVLEAPFLALLRESLSDKSLRRPTSVVEKQRSTTWIYIGRRFLPGVLMVYFVGNVIEISCFSEYFSRRWTEEFLYGLIYVLLPLSPLMFPSFWLGVNYIILARVLSVFQKFKRKKFKHEQLHEAKLTDSIYVVKTDWFSTWKRFWCFVKGTHDMLYQTSNIVHTLGNVTSVCCIDKKGILSWPNPNPEKISVLRARSESGSTSKISLRHSSNSLQEIVHMSEDSLSAKIFERHNSLSVVHEEAFSGVTEVLDITQSGGRAFDIDFDDPHWIKLENSLKPIGLAILLNTCNKDVQDYNRAVTDHLCCVAHNHDPTVPVVSHRCLCCLSKLIGFTPAAEHIFKQIHRMAFYRKPGKTPPQLEGRYKSPFPNMFSVIVQDRKSGGLQVLSQGTADVILDTCSDYWNGQEVCALTEEDRKQILEFYTRFSMTAYCVAFAYSPVTETVPEHESDSESDEEDVCVELPTEGEDVSTHELTSQISGTETRALVKDLHESCCKNQVFLGCLGYQYQSRNEFVHLIDLLEQACIRFVHFSPETELRSRVFAERLGLESGWNCHISLNSQGIDPTSIEPTDISQSLVPSAESAKKTKTTIVVEPEINLENRARLPRGIENIRGHIESVDNVPLLVSLFTDCQPASVKEMIAIMQENGEVVCCLGSSANISNSTVFLQADASIAIEPMYPQVCRTTPVFSPSSDKLHSHCLPTELMRTITSLNCSLSCQKEDPLSLMQLIIESRHNLSVLRNCSKYLISSGIALVILNLLSNTMCLPPPISLGHLLLLTCLSIPILSASLLSAPHDRNLMRISTGKNRHSDVINGDSVFRFVRTFVMRWLPSLFMVLLCQMLLLSESCKYGPRNCYPTMPNLTQPRGALSLTQNFSALLVILYFDVISMGYGNCKPGFWKYSPLKNLFWILAVSTGFCMHLVYFFSDTRFSTDFLKASGNFSEEAAGAPQINGGVLHWYDIPMWVWLVGFLWPVVLLPLNELIKKFELAEMDKLQKRARLQFGTKLGMNSPF